MAQLAKEMLQRINGYWLRLFKLWLEKLKKAL